METFTSYTSREDAFFYALVFDPHQKTLLADRGNIRIGSEYQAAVPAVTKEAREEDLEELQWQPNNNLEEDKIDQFVIISRSVGTFARALDCSSSVKQPSLHMSAAAASRDITVLHAYQVQYMYGTMTHHLIDKFPVIKFKFTPGTSWTSVRHQPSPGQPGSSHRSSALPR